MTQLSNDGKIVPATRAVSKTAGAATFDPCRGFHANQAGTVTVTFADASSTVDLIVVAGVTYPYSLQGFSVGAGITLVLLY